MATAVIVGQQRPSGQAKVLTVCEVLGNVTHNANTAVAVVGRMEQRGGLIDRSTFLSQDQCEHPVVTHGHVWPDEIQILDFWEAGMPKPPTDRPTLEGSVVGPKLLMIRKTTELGFHQEIQFKPDGHSIGYTAVPNKWAIVYGRIVSMPRLNGPNAPVGIIAQPFNVRLLGDDGMPLP